ncbi:hypothetical protein FMM05_19980 [Flavobacterium zepuense]|uniref:Abortive infection protein-like C-terminal domain-containing protein n=1 Tax=Flavobacterium zepuense TaxID=2593302 RepID=A0A552UTJ6_9FLAO|nr:abortive infection family protein [Flavobacterium zepuense]TRW21538.1 hypothetical protein FMM05_19980 [Flavobacterium zepuense]
MAELSYSERQTIEKFVAGNNGAGYVLDFSDRTFQEFVGDVVGLDISDEKYKEAGNSKANRLRTFCRVENDYTVGKLLASLHDYKLSSYTASGKNIDVRGFDEFHRIAERLSSGQVIEHIDAIQANNSDKDFHQLAKLIKESIEKNQPEAALDRLHTFLIKFLKELCKSHGVEVSKDETVNALYGKYIKAVRGKGFIESDMAVKIVQYSFQVMDAFNDIRNNKSFAHDNAVLNYDESILIFSNVTSTVKFIQTIEAKHSNVAIAEAKPDWDSF